MVESEETRSLGRRENIKKDLQEVECEGMDWIDLAKNSDRWWVVVNAVMNLSVSIKCGEFLISFSSRTLLHGVNLPRRYNIDGRINTDLPSRQYPTVPTVQAERRTGHL